MRLCTTDVRCEVYAFEDGEQPLLVLEDLRDGRWPPPWEPGDIDRVLDDARRHLVDACS